MSEKGLERIAEELLKEYRRHRRGRWIFRAVVLLLLLAVLLAPFLEDLGVESGLHTAVIDLQGVIGIGADASAERINEGLRDAFESDEVKGVVLRINSPGGSPVQSRQIYSEINRLRKEFPDKPVYGVVEEICASGGYYVAAATDKIFADPASIVGSIGVRLDGFGFVEAMGKLGIERRLLTAGENKGILDPFLPMAEEDEVFARTLLDRVHNQFIQAVKEGRGDRLKSDAADLFSGLFWAGEDALQLGLIDDYGTVDSVARDIIGEEEVINYTPGYDLLDQISKDLGVSVAGFFARLRTQVGLRLE